MKRGRWRIVFTQWNGATTDCEPCSEHEARLSFSALSKQRMYCVELQQRRKDQWVTVDEVGEGRMIGLNLRDIKG